MTLPGNIKATHKAIKEYREALDAYAGQRVTHEGATETAFQRLLSDTARSHGWMLVPKLYIRRGANSIAPDGTVRDAYNLHRGYWEAKDTNDDLNVEIRKKITRGYPLTNTIFEDTTRAVLYQNGNEALRADLTDPQALADLLNAFFGHTEPDIQSFERAVDEFKERVPDLALALAQIIKDSHDKNQKFQAAFEKFLTLCQTALNPNIRRDAVDEMLIQHLLTERLIRTIFDKDDFTRQNVIASEVETVIDALTGQSFSRHKFLKGLDKFYVAIEHAAANLEDFREKQRFLNTVYERFFQGYSVKVADTHGIVYTPQEIVDFMCASVTEVLEKEFGKSLGDENIHILDPCTGTGNFIVNLINRIPKKDLPRMYRQQLFANEVMLLPYYIAALNIERAYYERTGNYESFNGLCFVDTLDLVEKKQKLMAFMNEENTQRVERQRKSPITVVIGNPPYNANQLNENDNNKNRKYTDIDKRIKLTYVAATSATKTKCYDPYVRFFRWASDRLQSKHGILCFVTNNSFVQQSACDGLRHCLAKEFSAIYHIDLRGNVRQNPTLSGTAYNVFGIQVGVGITVAVRGGRSRGVRFTQVDLSLRRHQKLKWLADRAAVSAIKWTRPGVKADGEWIKRKEPESFLRGIPLIQKDSAHPNLSNGIFARTSLGISTNRDSIVYAFNKATVAKQVEEFGDAYMAELARYQRKGRHGDVSAFVDHTLLKWSRNLKRAFGRGRAFDFEAKRTRPVLYRPFTNKYVYFAEMAVDELGSFPEFLPINCDNTLIAVTGPGAEKPFMVMFADTVCDLHLVGAGAGAQCFPRYLYADDTKTRCDNITDWALSEFRKHYHSRQIHKQDIFLYVYGMLHHPGYRKKYADNLKRELPRIPFAHDFSAFSKAGENLAKLHLEYANLKEWPLKWIESTDTPLSYLVEKMKLARDKKSIQINDSLTLAEIPPETFEYRLGNRSALEWVIDQYQVSEDKRSGIKSDPNRADDPEYIVRLVGQLVRVSVETMQIVNGLPAFE